jgi:hypothetical protein
MEPQNREQRRHPEQFENPDEDPKDENPRRIPEDDMTSAARTQDDLSVRAKNAGHGKKTADKWNQ